ncbi:hypothetical protein, partial [Vibrio azureus]|uniref:hypothetical protein n=1 Tax=Vibrio azureus TaxID=512649 RepID=UPI001D10734C
MHLFLALVSAGWPTFSRRRFLLPLVLSGRFDRGFCRGREHAFAAAFTQRHRLDSIYYRALRVAIDLNLYHLPSPSWAGYDRLT